MAEVLGVVSGAIGIAGFALQIVENVQKLREFGSKIKHSRAQLDVLLDELDLLANLVAQSGDASNTDPPVPDPGRNQIPIDRCQKAAKNVLSVSNEVQRVLDGSGKPWASLKFVLQEKQIERLMRKLERAKSMLMIAQQCLARSQLHEMQQHQSRNFEMMEKILTSSDAKAVTQTYQRARDNMHLVKGRQGSHSSYWLLLGTLLITFSSYGDNGLRLKLSPASWTRLSSGFEFIYRKAFGRPQYHLRAFRMILRNDPVWIACARGDQEEVKRLFSERLASPYDATEDGSTLLHISATFHRAKVCKLLLDYGVDASSLSCIELSGSYKFAKRTPLGMATCLATDTDQKKIYDDTPWALSQREVCALSEFQDLSRYQPCSSDVLDTIRTLVEVGEAEPIEGGTENDSALANFTLPFEDCLGYLLLHLEKSNPGEIMYTARQLSLNSQYLHESYLLGYSLQLFERGIQLLNFKSSQYPLNIALRYLIPLLPATFKFLDSSPNYSCCVKSLLSLLIRMGANFYPRHLSGLSRPPLEYYPWMNNSSLLWRMTYASHRLAFLASDEFYNQAPLNPHRRLADSLEHLLNTSIMCWLEALENNDIDLFDYLHREAEYYLELPHWARTNAQWGNFNGQGLEFFTYSGYPFETCLEFLLDVPGQKPSVNLRLRCITLESVEEEVREALGASYGMPGAWGDEEA